MKRQRDQHGEGTEIGNMLHAVAEFLEYYLPSDKWTAWKHFSEEIGRGQVNDGLISYVHQGGRTFIL